MTEAATLLDHSPGPSLARLTRRLRRGTLIAGTYTLEAPVSQSAVDLTWNVHDEGLDAPLSMRLVPSDAAHAEALLAQYRREVWLSRSIDHHALAHAQNTGADEGVYFVTQQRLAGAALPDLLRTRTRFGADEVSRLGAEIADVLDHIHGAGAIHGALHPQSVIVTERGHAALRSAGTALSLNQAARGVQHPVGLSRYLAPEQLLGIACDVHVDVYALGLLLFEMLAGVAPFADASPVVASARRLREDAPELPAELHAPPHLAAAIKRCLARSADDRFESARELARCLTARSVSVLLPRLDPSAPAHVVVGDFESATSAMATVAAALPDALAATLRQSHGVHARTGTVAHTRLAGVGRLFSLTGRVSGDSGLARVHAQLRDGATGASCWSGSFEMGGAAAGDPTSIVWRVAEPVRITLQCLTAARGLTLESIEKYRLARRLVREGNFSDPDDALVLLDEVLRESPSFGPAHAVRAMACVRGWSILRASDARHDWFDEAQTSLAQCQTHCPDAPETWFARAHLAAQLGRYQDAIAAIREALTRAPTMPEAHQVLGSLQLEAGRSQLGLERLDLALVLDPYLPRAILEQARWMLLYGDPTAAEERLTALARLPQTDHMVAHLRARAGVWRRDVPAVRAALAALKVGNQLVAPLMVAWSHAALGDTPVDEALRKIEGAMTAASTPKVRSQFRQLCVELLCARGDWVRGAAALSECAASTLVDLEWIDWCPLLDGLRGRPEFDRSRALVAARSADIWQL